MVAICLGMFVFSTLSLDNEHFFVCARVCMCACMCEYVCTCERVCRAADRGGQLGHFALGPTLLGQGPGKGPHSYIIPTGPHTQ